MSHRGGAMGVCEARRQHKPGRALTKNRVSGHLDLRHPASELWESKRLVQVPQSVQQTRTLPWFLLSLKYSLEAVLNEATFYSFTLCFIKTYACKVTLALWSLPSNLQQAFVPVLNFCCSFHALMMLTLFATYHSHILLDRILLATRTAFTTSVFSSGPSAVPSN